MTQNWLENNIIYIRPFSCSMRARRKVTPALAGSRTWSPHPRCWHSSGPRCQQERGHTRMSKSERRNCWNYTFNFHQAASTSGGGPVGQCHLGHRTPGTQGCLLLCNGQQDTSHLNWCIIKHNFQLQIIFTPRVKNRALISKMNLKTFILAPKSN